MAPEENLLPNTGREGLPLKATLPDWIVNKSLNILKEREAMAASYVTAANNALASADAIATSGASNRAFAATTTSPPPNGGLKQV